MAPLRGFEHRAGALGKDAYALKARNTTKLQTVLEESYPLATENRKDDLAARLAALIVDQERLLEVIREKKPKLIRVDPATPSTVPPTPT